MTVSARWRKTAAFILAGALLTYSGVFQVGHGYPRSLINDERLPAQPVGFYGGVSCDHCGVRTAPGFFERGYDEEGAKPRDDRGNHGDHGLSQCQRLLPARGLGGLPLGAQVGMVTLLGAAFLWVAAFGAAGLLGVLDGSRPARIRSWLLIGVCLPVGTALYSLAALGDWRAVFGLCRL